LIDEQRLLDELLLLELEEAEEQDACRADPARLVSHMWAPDERTGERFSFAHMRDEAVAAVAPWGWQRSEFLMLYEEKRSITLKARQLGLTWISCAALVVDALLRPGSLVLVYRQKEEEAHENVRRCWDLLQSLPKFLWFGAEVIKPIKGALPSGEIRLRFPNGSLSRILAMTSASSAGHGKTVRRVLMDEHSRIDNVGEIMKAVQPAAGKHGHINIVSTANGVSNPETGDGNQFHWIWMNAEDAGFAKRFLPWSLHPDRDQDWYDKDPEIRGLKSHERAEQYPADEFEAFTLTNRVFFDPEDLLWYGKEGLREPLFRMDFENVEARAARLKKHDRGAIRVYAEPVADHAYAIGADVATGRGVDYSAAYVVDLSDMSFVAEFHARLDADLYAAQLHFLGRWYNDALLAVESAGGFGEAVIIPLRDGRAGRPAYPRLYRHVLSSRPDLPTAKPYGFPTNTKTRPLMVNNFERALRERQLPWLTRNLLAEMQTFVLHDHGPSPAAQTGARDDLVMAAAITLELYRMRGHHANRIRKKTRRPKPAYPWQRVNSG
jgi:hypothetical protein